MRLIFVGGSSGKQRASTLTYFEAYTPCQAFTRAVG